MPDSAEQPREMKALGCAILIVFCVIVAVKCSASEGDDEQGYGGTEVHGHPSHTDDERRKQRQPPRPPPRAHPVI